MRDMLDDNIERVRIDSREAYQRAITFCDQFMPDMRTQVEYYPGERPIFDIYGVEDEIQKALERKVQLKSGGYVILDQTDYDTVKSVVIVPDSAYRNVVDKNTLYSLYSNASYSSLAGGTLSFDALLFDINPTRYLANGSVPSLREAMARAMGFDYDDVLEHRGQRPQRFLGMSGAEIIRKAHAKALSLVHGLSVIDYQPDRIASVTTDAPRMILK